MSSPWEDYRRQPMITFRTPAPPDTPEVKGYRAYFQPTELAWTVRKGSIRVCAIGPTTRSKTLKTGEMSWEAGGLHDNRPNWLLMPVEALTHATLAADRIAREIELLWAGGPGE